MGDRRVRAYVGLGANVGDAAGDAGVGRGARWRVCRACALPGSRRCTRPRRGASRTSPTSTTRWWRWTCRPDRTPRPGRSRCSASSRSSSASPDVAGGDAGARASSTSTCWSSGGTGSTSSGRPRPAPTTPSRTPTRPRGGSQVPHRDAGERLFVLAPLADLAPRLVPPGWRETVETRRRRVAATEPPDAVRRIGRWDPDRSRWVRRPYNRAGRSVADDDAGPDHGGPR